MGAGRVDLTKAGRAGLILDETFPNYLAADPAMGGDPRTLNIPSMQDSDYNGVCSWTRPVESPLTSPVTWTASTSGPSWMDLRVLPASFAITGGATHEIGFTVVVLTGAPLGSFDFRAVTLTPDDPTIPETRFPIAIIPTDLGEEIFADGFDLGDTSAWSSTVP
ncbi:MAG: hypothetical protein V3R89_04730 [Thermoanaerobaculia bacterium]